MDSQFRIGVFAGACVLVAVITYARFCGSLSLPDKPPPPAEPTGTQRQLITKTSTSFAMYQEYLARDAASAGVRTPSIEDMSRKLPYRVDEGRHILEPGQPAIETAGLRLRVERSNDSVVLIVQNLVGAELAYNVVTKSSTVCGNANPLPLNVMVIAKGASETRTECAWREGMSIIVTKVETLEVGPLASYYLARVPPALVGIEERIARGHTGTDSRESCTAVMSQVVRTGIDRGDIGWRDLVDFYARHRCQTFHFPPSYRAFKSDGERGLPAGD